ncbi:MAG: NAD(P)-binding protein [Candidatus Vogelbacteria bacterium]|nr:NAD(P)-binding protein [Candidatus Vogelbacteria bacterium]
MQEEIIIVGGGLAGLGCAKRLHEAGKKFKLISENIGGRIKVSPDGKVNYGAYYITADCKNILPYMRKIERMKFREMYFHKNGKRYLLFSPRIIKHLPAYIKLLWDVTIFRKHFNKSRGLATEKSRQELIEADPFLKKYYHQKAGEYIRDRKLESLMEEYLSQILWGEYFIDSEEMPTFVFMQCLIPLIVPVYAFELDFKNIYKDFEEGLIKDSVTKVEKQNGKFTLNTKTGSIYTCDKLVLATPMNITNGLVPPQPIKNGIDVSFFHVHGQIKPAYNTTGYNFFPVSIQAALSKENDGTFLYFYTGENKIDKYFDNYEVITKGEWKPALFLLGDRYLNLNPEPNLFLANDHDVASTEDAFINGMYTAKLVLDNKLHP